MTIKVQITSVLVVSVGCVASIPATAAAQATVGGVVSQVGFDQKLGAQLPLDLAFRDETGRELRLAELFGQRPMILCRSIIAVHSCVTSFSTG